MTTKTDAHGDPSKLPEGYHIRNGCRNCGFCFVLEDFEDHPVYFCMASAPPRVPMGAREQPFGNYSGAYEAWIALDAAWRAWTKGRQVYPDGICPRWMRRR